MATFAPYAGVEANAPETREVARVDHRESTFSLAAKMSLFSYQYGKENSNEDGELTIFH